MSSKPEQSRGHALFVDGYEFYVTDGNLFRASLKETIGKDGRRQGELWVGKPAAKFAVRALRLAAGLPENG